jgi:hypothetical protein
MSIPQVHLTPRREIKRTDSHTRAFPLTEKPPMHNCKPDSLHRIADFLDVENSARYLPNSAQTFCNIYAYDFAYCCGAYLPRVWWTPEIIKTGVFREVIYGKTVREMNVNLIYDWFLNYGQIFQWKEVSLDKAQSEANNGKLAIIIAANISSNRSGHVSIVLPETSALKAINKPSFVPIQSNAGRKNEKVFIRNWWSKNHKPVKCYVYA